MILEARSRSCFSSQYVLKTDGRPNGEFCGRWFNEGIDVRLQGQRRLRFAKASWLGSQFSLTDDAHHAVLAKGSRGGAFTSAWDLELSTGPARFVSAGVFNTKFLVMQAAQAIAEVDRLGFCENGWYVEDDESLDETDLLFIGLIYHTVLRRRAAAAATTASAG